MESSPSARWQVLGWVVGLVVMATCASALDWVGEQFGVAAEIELDEPITIAHGGGRTIWEEETDTLTTWFGQLRLGLAIAVGALAGFVVAHRRLDAGWTRVTWVNWTAWFVALATLAFIAIVVECVFTGTSRGDRILRRMTQLVSTVGVAAACYSWSQVQRRWHENKAAAHTDA